MSLQSQQYSVPSDAAGAATSARDDSAKTAVLYRMLTDKHICPSGLKTRHLLKQQGFEIDDRPLRSRAQTDAFLEEHEVKTTPQVYINGERIGGYEALRRHLGLDVRDPNATTYQPVMAVFAMALAMALAIGAATAGPIISIATVELFVGFAMALLALQKLRDLASFSDQFLTYDLVAQRYVPYAFIYPFAEAAAGLGMLWGAVPGLFGTISLLIGGAGAVSVYKAVYIDKRELKCACVGGKSNVPLGPISLTENVVMVAMGLWMLGKAFAI